MPGTLFVIATPLGNLEDLSPRAARVLREVDCVACEDTRRTARLLARHGIRTRTLSCHRFNEHARLEPVLALLRDGRDVALVSDSGTPGIADPGRFLVTAALKKRIRVCPVPGPSAVAALLSASGLPADRFVFEGFLPSRAGERRRRLRELARETRTVVLFETPHRIVRSLLDMEAILGERAVVLGRELTKRHEQILRGTPRELADVLSSGESRGEYTLAVAGAEPGAHPASGEDEALLAAWKEALRESGGDRRKALQLAARSTGLRRPELFRKLQELDEEAN